MTKLSLSFSLSFTPRASILFRPHQKQRGSLTDGRRATDKEGDALAVHDIHIAPRCSWWRRRVLPPGLHAKHWSGQPLATHLVPSASAPRPEPKPRPLFPAS